MSVEAARKRLEEERQRLGIVTPTEDLGDFSMESAKEGLEAAREKLKVARDNLEIVPEADPEGVFERIIQNPYQRAVERQVETFERMATPGATNTPSVILQTLSNPISMGIDMAANAVVMGAEEAIGMLLPDDMEEAAKQKLVEAMNSEAGQAALGALAKGEQAWKTFSDANPNEAANFAGFADIFFGVPREVIKNFSPNLAPMKIEKVGLRKVQKPMEGIDKDIYNIAFSKPGGGRTPQQAEKVTDPSGLLGVQKQLADETQLAVVDELRKAGVSGNKTLQQNFNSMLGYLDKLDNTVIKMSRRVKDPIDMTVLRQNVAQEVSQMISQNPAVFTATPKSMRKKVNELVSQFMTHVQEKGNSAEGIIEARRAFDSDMERMGMDLGTSKTSTNILLARAVRNAANKSIFSVVPEAEQVFAKMSRVLSVYDTVAVKAAQEASTSLGRLAAELGLDKLIGERAGSQLFNIPLAMGYAVVASPVVMIRRAMKAETPARGRAKIAYAVRDIKDEINKGIQMVKDPKRRASLLKSKPAAWVALEAAAEKLEREYEEDADG